MEIDLYTNQKRFIYKSFRELRIIGFQPCFCTKLKCYKAFIEETQNPFYINSKMSFVVENFFLD
ncbi:hypothetical protein HQ40_06545 [Porphyromonas gulae]|nr:hypothetical protein HR09_06905 [Porphyromonas gulae]KGN75308.1 hypothetical protein HQ40_06545 [Porphyromonas gulae]